MSDPGNPEDTTSPLSVGTRVEVRAGFDNSWTGGWFAVEELTDRGYLLRRRSDRQVLPAEFVSDTVRRERKNSMWWH